MVMAKRIGLILLMILTGCAGGVLAAAKDEVAVAQADGLVDALADALLTHLRETSAYARLVSSRPITRLDDLSPEQARRSSAFGRRQLVELAAISLQELPHEQWLLARMLHHSFTSLSHAEEDYWLTFAVTPYSGGFALNGMNRVLAAQPLETAEQRDNYLRLLDSYAAMLEQIVAKTRAQAERGIRVPQPAIAGVRATMSGLKASAPQVLGASPDRLGPLPEARAAAFAATVARRISARIEPAYQRIVDLFDADYVAQAPASVGLGELPGGRQNYLRRITHETGLSLTPEQIHQRGLADIAELEQQMQAIRTQLGFKGDRAAFHDMLRSEPRFFAKTPQELEQRYLDYMRRIEPQIPKFFSKLPRARYGVKRVEPSAEAGMTYGYYQRPTPADPVGYYRYNGSKLNQDSLVTAAHIIYHELAPGHHFQIALQLENEGVHPVRGLLSYGAFSEGWAEYGAGLAEEMGVLDDPYDRYGHLVSQAFLATRLVVDTGMNYLGWSLERSRRYMRDHTFESQAQIDTDSLRYSTDIFAQALGYRLGYHQFRDLRRRAEQALGERFDLPRFHEAAIGSGAMPLDVLAEHIDWYIAREQSRAPESSH